MEVKTAKFRTQRASGLVNLDTYTADTDLIFSKADGENKTYIGRAYQASPLIGGGVEFGTVIQNVFKTVPDDTVIQVSMVCAPDHDAAEVFGRNKTHGGPMIQELVARQQKLIQDAMNIGWRDGFPLLNERQVIITLATPVSMVSNAALETAAQLQTEFLASLKGCGFLDVRVLSAGALVGMYRHFSNIFKPAQTVALDDMTDLKFQVFGPDQRFDFRDPRVGLFNDDVHCTAVVCKSYPEMGSHGLMNLAAGAPFNHGPTREGGGQRIATPYILSTTVRVANQRKEWSRIDKAIASRKVVQKLPFKLGNEDPAQKMADLELLKRQCSDDGNKIVFVSTSAFLFGKTEAQAIQAAAIVKGTLDKLGFDARTAVDNVLVRWAQNLPLNFSPKIADALAGACTMSASAASALLPVFGDYLGNAHRGGRHTGSMYFTRRGSAHFFDCFNSNSNFSGTIAAAPGSGKSFALQAFIRDNLADGANIFLLDNGKSSKKFCAAVGGEFNEFGGESSFVPSLNPFSGLSAKEFDEQQDTITSLLLLMAYGSEPPDPGAAIAMGESVKAAYAQKGAMAGISDVIASLQSTKDANREGDNMGELQRAVSNLIPRLRSFMDAPARGQYFDGEATLNLSNPLTVFELGTLGNDEKLKKCVLFFVLNMLLTRIKTVPGRKMVIVDEAHDLLKDDLAADVMEGIYLKGRKEKVSCWIVVQSLVKLNETKAGPVILNQSEWKMILKQTPEAIDRIISEEVITAFSGDPWFEKTIKSVDTVKGAFSEILILSPTTYEVVRLHVDKFTEALFSSEGDARDAVFDLMKAGMDAVQAVKAVMSDKKAARGEWLKGVLSKVQADARLTKREFLEEINACFED